MKTITTKNYPRITIVTPSFNQANYLPETIESILNQNYPNLEYIIIDGGSTDGTVDIIKKYESHLSYWVSERDKGQSDAIMKGFAKSSGELFTWVNSDDVLFPGCLNRIARCCQRKKDSDIITGNVVYIDSDGKITRFIRVPPPKRFFFYRGVWYAQAPVIFFRSKLFRKVGGLNLKYHLCMDLDIWTRMMNANAQVAHVKEYMGGYRWHKQAKSVVAKDKRRYGWSKEGTEIRKLYVPSLSLFESWCWRRVYKVYQVFNLNYLRSYLSCKPVKRMYWKDAVNELYPDNSESQTY